MRPSRRLIAGVNTEPRRAAIALGAGLTRLRTVPSSLQTPRVVGVKTADLIIDADPHLTGALFAGHPLIAVDHFPGAAQTIAFLHLVWGAVDAARCARLAYRLLTAPLHAAVIAFARRCVHADPSPAQISRTPLPVAPARTGERRRVEHRQRLGRPRSRGTGRPQRRPRRRNAASSCLRSGTSPPSRSELGRFCQRRSHRHCTASSPKPHRRSALGARVLARLLTIDAGARRPASTAVGSPRLAGRRIRSSRSPKQKVRRDASAAPKRNQRRCCGC